MIPKTQQQWRNDCNINTIIKRAKSGNMPTGTNKTPQYGNWSQHTNLLQAKIQVQEANDSFMALDPKLREKFSNRPENLVAFVSDAKNLEEAIDLGLVSEDHRPAKPAPQVINPDKPEDLNKVVKK